MRTRVAALLGLMLLGFGCARAGELHLWALNSPYWPCDGTYRTVQFTNTQSKALRIRIVDLGFVTDNGQLGEMGLSLLRADDTIILQAGQDKEVGTSGFSLHTLHLAPDWITVGVGETLTMQVMCYPYNGVKNVIGVVNLYWTDRVP